MNPHFYRYAAALLLAMCVGSSNIIGSENKTIAHNSELISLAAIMPPLEQPTVAACCHVLIYYQLGQTDLVQFPSGNTALLVLTDERMAIKFFGTSPLIKTRFG